MSAVNQLARYIAKQEYKNHRLEFQRKGSTHDVEGQEHFNYGMFNSPATLYVSISEDLEYFYRWSFKFKLSPLYATSTSGTQSTTLTLTPNPLPAHTITVNPHNAPLVAPLNHTLGPGTNLTHAVQNITPNPHTHTVGQGVFPVASVPEGLEIWIDGFNFTPFFIAQYPPTPTGGYPSAINGWGNLVYPTTNLFDKFSVIDASIAMGNPVKDIVLSSGFHIVEFRTNPFTAGNQASFSVSLINYIQYSHLLR